MPLRNAGFVRASNALVKAGSVYLSLHTSEPGETGADEVAATGSYARKAVAASEWTVASDGTITNNAEIAFADATASWGTVTHVAVRDGTGGGAAVLLDVALPAALNPDASSPSVAFAAGEITVAPNP